MGAVVQFPAASLIALPWRKREHSSSAWLVPRPFVPINPSS
jgi:hypothetical protein